MLHQSSKMDEAGVAGLAIYMLGFFGGDASR